MLVLINKILVQRHDNVVLYQTACKKRREWGKNPDSEPV